jgi:hypothetical protein
MNLSRLLHRGLSVKQLLIFCSTFTVTSITVPSQKYFAESSNCKAKMVRLMKLTDFGN